MDLPKTNGPTPKKLTARYSEPEMRHMAEEMHHMAKQTPGALIVDI